MDTSNRPASFDPRVALPNPEARPLAEWLTPRFLEAMALDSGTMALEVLFLSREVLNEPAVHLRDLEELWRAWCAARNLKSAAAEAAFVGSAALRGTALGVMLIALGQTALAAAAAHPERLRAFSLLLRGVVYAYRFHGHFFGLHHKLGADLQVRGSVNATGDALLHARNQAYGGIPVSYFGPEVSDPVLLQLARVAKCRRLRPHDPAVLRAVRHCVEQGVPVCIEVGGVPSTIAAARADCEEFIFFDPVRGVSQDFSREEFDQLVEHIKTMVILEGDLSDLDRM